MARRRKDPAKSAQKWSRGVATSSQAFTDGVNGVTDSPMAKAADKAQLWSERVSTQQARERFEANTRAYTLSQWKERMLGVGKRRMDEGAQAATPKVERFLRDWNGYTVTVMDEIDATVPRGTLQDNIRRSNLFIEAAAAYRGRGKQAARGQRGQ